MKDPYYGRPEVSNSDLSEIKKYWQPQQVTYDLEQAYKFGTLIDCMITEPDKIDYFQYTCAGVQYTSADFIRAESMKKAFYRDPLCVAMANQSQYQKVSIRKNFPIMYGGFVFTLDVRCKWDLFIDNCMVPSGDIKSTTATTQKQFEAAVRYFDYDRQRAWYMDIEGRDKDILIGISKVNYKVFKVPIVRGSELYLSGREKYEELAFKYWYLFGDVHNIRRAA
ncbi:hypothetical protein ACE38W_00625 [Chitinophaga sp. Hz27]|uniref:hypothetical protein n=1 Tax=Chitinophaga sp. Hz27 TaxID=3347169 RepID=UPI0035E36EBC